MNRTTLGITIVSSILILTALGFANRNKNISPAVEEANHALPTGPAPLIKPASSLSFKDVKIKYGSALSTVLKKQGVHSSEASEIIKTLSKVYNPRRIKAGEIFTIGRDSTGQVKSLRYSPSSAVTIKIDATPTGLFSADVDTLPVEIETSLLTGTIENSLYQAVLDAGESPELIASFADIFQWDIDFLIDPRTGDRFNMVFEKHFIVDTLSDRRTLLRYGNILAGSYSSKNRTFIAIGHKNEKGRIQYFDTLGHSFQKTFLKSPLNYRRISSYFSKKRRHPILKKVRAHNGVDYAAMRGTPVVSAANGKIKYIGRRGGYGKCIIVTHKNGYETLYGHLSKFARKLRKGSSVSQNQVIGFVGATGLATGPHLHYTMLRHGKPINPLRLRPTAGASLSGDALPAFKATRNVLLTQLGVVNGEQKPASASAPARAR